MTANYSKTNLYRYYDSVTAGILNRWAEQYSEEHNVTYDQALVVVLMEVNLHSRGVSND